MTNAMEGAGVVDLRASNPKVFLHGEFRGTRPLSDDFE